uniref:Uncharacterized protein n=1 Tax=Lepeophtheirus salmonis TaxID=72036 RepID=A0A0K2VET4_LEPSM
MDLLDNINIKMFGATLLPLVGTSLIKFITGTKIDKNWINHFTSRAVYLPSFYNLLGRYKVGSDSYNTCNMKF